MAKVIGGKINLSKIDKKRIFVSKDGDKYLDIVLIETPGGKHGDWMINESITKEERDRGVKGTILGNGKNLGGGSGRSSSPPPQQTSSGFSDDMPF